MFSKILASSRNPENISLTIKGALGTLVPVVVMFAKAKGFDHIDSAQLNHIVDLIADLAVTVSGLISLSAVIWGSVRKLLPNK